MKKKKKSGSIAIPFLLTFLISLIIIGGIAIVIYDKIDNDNSSLITMNNEAGTLSEADSHTIMLILDLSKSKNLTENKDDEESSNEESSDDSEDSYEWEEPKNKKDEEKTKNKPYTFMIMRSIPVNKQLIFIGLPENMHAGEQNKTLTEIFKSGGGAELKSAAEFSLEIPIDRYMVFDSKSFQKICNILGGVNFAVPKNIEGFKKTDGLQYLSPDQIEKIICCGTFGGGEVQRVSTAASLITSMVNQTNGTRIADNLDNTFETLVNANDTDISALDYQQKKYAIKFLLKFSDAEDSEQESDRAKFLTPAGTLTSDSFILDTSFINEIARYFITQNAETQPIESSLIPMMPETEADTNEQ